MRRCRQRTRTSLLCLATVTTLARSASATEPTRVELLTIGPGRALESRFGHAVLCVFSARYPAGECFNYGATRARHELLEEIVFGDALFLLKREPYGFMLDLYTSQDRDIYQQALPLSEDEARALVLRLEYDSLPGNREYVYRPFTDNCSTRVRDVLNEATHGGLQSLQSSDGVVTYRQHVRDMLSDHARVLAALDLVLGAEADRMLDKWDAMFAPPYLRAAVAEVFGANATPLHIGWQGPVAATKWTGRTPVVLCAPVFLVVALLGTCAGRWWRAAVLLVLGTFLGIVSLLPLVLAIGSALPEAWPNYAAFLWMPTDFVVAVLGVVARSDRSRVVTMLWGYILARLLLLIGLGLASVTGIVSQPLWAPLAVPLATMGGIVGGLWLRPHATWRDSSTAVLTPVPSTVQRPSAPRIARRKAARGRSRVTTRRSPS